MAGKKRLLLAMLAAYGSSGGSGSVGTAGQPGFGCGTYPGPDSDLTEIGLTGMDGYDDPASDNYGNYVHTNGSVMVFIPAFCYRIGNANAPSYSRDGANALEIGAADLNGTDGWILHRAFIDGGEQKLGFFIDKYLCSKSTKNLNVAVSVKNCSPICLSSSYNNSSAMPGCSGAIYDAITLSAARGEAYACVSAFQWSAIAMLSLAHGQAATSSAYCAWYDPNHAINFPKGNNSSLRDTNDSSVTFMQAVVNSGNTSLTGSGTPFAKTTHNGQECGVTDINGDKYQPLLGLMQSNGFCVAKESVKMHSFTISNYNSPSQFDSAVSTSDTVSFSTNQRFGNGSNAAFFGDSSGSKRALCGVVPKAGGQSPGGTALFGSDYGYYYNDSSGVVLAAGNYNTGSDAGVWCRYGRYYVWGGGSSDVGFRAAGYAK